MDYDSQNEAASATLQRVSELCEFLHKNRHLAFLGESEEGMRTALVEGIKECGFSYTRTQVNTLVYRDMDRREDQRILLIVEDLVVVDVRTVDALNEYHRNQLSLLIGHLERPLGLIVNFGGGKFDPELFTVTSEDGEE